MDCDQRDADIKAMEHIFISYRREDSADVTGRIYDSLKSHFGAQAIFKDVDRIPFGVDFRNYLDGRLDQCRAVLVVIGRHWLDASNERGVQRLSDPADFVRVEIETALARNIPVIPLLVHGTEMPQFDELPEGLRDLSFRNAIPVRRDPDFHNDMARLINGLKRQLDLTALGTQAATRPPPKPRRPRRNWLAHGLSALFLLAGVGVGIVAMEGWLSRPPTETLQPSSNSQRSPATDADDTAGEPKVVQQHLASESASPKRVDTAAAAHPNASTALRKTPAPVSGSTGKSEGARVATTQRNTTSVVKSLHTPAKSAHSESTQNSRTELVQTQQKYAENLRAAKLQAEALARAENDRREQLALLAKSQQLQAEQPAAIENASRAQAQREVRIGLFPHETIRTCFHSVGSRLEEAAKQAASTNTGVRIGYSYYDPGPAPRGLGNDTRVWTGNAVKKTPSMTEVRTVSRALNVDAVLMGWIDCSDSPHVSDYHYQVDVFLVDVLTSKVYSAQVGLYDTNRTVRDLLRQLITNRG